MMGLATLCEGACRSSGAPASAPPPASGAQDSGAPTRAPAAPAAPASEDGRQEVPEPAACAARAAGDCACATPQECQGRLAAWLKPSLDACAQDEWDCGWAEAAFDEHGCALPLPARPKRRFAACLQRALDERRWPCLSSAGVRLNLGSCTLM